MSGCKSVVGKTQVRITDVMGFYDNFAALPPGTSIDQLAYVRNTTGVFLINRHKRGVYRWTGAIWEFGPMLPAGLSPTLSNV